MSQLFITREQATAIDVACGEFNAEGALVTGSAYRGDITVALVEDDGVTNIATLVIDSLGESDQDQ